MVNDGLRTKEGRSLKYNDKTQLFKKPQQQCMYTLAERQTMMATFQGIQANPKSKK
jgi:hypothetical protein